MVLRTAIATSSLLVRSCKLLCSCRDAARRRCHEFRPDWIGDRFAQDPVDLSLDGRIKPPAPHLVDRLQLVGMTRAPQRRGYTLIEHPADRQVNDAFAEALPSEPIEPFHGGQGWDVCAFMFGHEKLVYAGPLANEAEIMVLAGVIISVSYC